MDGTVDEIRREGSQTSAGPALIPAVTRIRYDGADDDDDDG